MPDTLKNNSNNITNNITNSSTISEDVSYNKRQFWEYKRLYGGSIKTKKKELSQNNNAKKTRTLLSTVNDMSMAKGVRKQVSTTKGKLIPSTPT